MDDETVEKIVALLAGLPWPEAQKALDFASHEVNVRDTHRPAPPAAAKEPPWGMPPMPNKAKEKQA